MLQYLYETSRVSNTTFFDGPLSFRKGSFFITILFDFLTLYP